MSPARLRRIFDAALAACDAERLTRAAVRRDGTRLVIERAGAARGEVALPAGRVLVLAAGKAALGQARAIAALLPEARGIVVAPAATELPGFVVLAGGHPLPDAGSLRAGDEALRLARRARPEDLLLCLISGGASAMLERPRDGVSLDDLRVATAALLGAGCDIATINAVRGRLSELKGGGLAAACAAPVVSLVLADVPDARPELVGSGPGVVPGDPAGVQARIENVLRGEAAARLPASVLRWLRAEVPRAAQPRSRAWVLAGPEDLRDAAVAAAAGEGVEARAEARRLDADVNEVAARVGAVAAQLRPGQLWVAVAEPTVVLCAAPGLGGRAGHLALLVARALRGRAGLTFLAAGSDGIDGTSAAAGAIVDGGTWDRANAAGLDADGALPCCDSATLHAALGTAVVTGPTGTNLNDLLLLLRDRPEDHSSLFPVLCSANSAA